MHEIRALIEAFDAASLQGELCALATVVSVEGSAYRRPGARMLVSAEGASTGTISAGCLEGDVIEHAKRAILSGEAKLVEYDTTSASDEMAWGLGLGCNGVVRVLVEPVSSNSLHIDALRRSLASPISMATALTPAGARLVIDEQGTVRHERMSAGMALELESAVRRGVPFGNVFIETLLPPVPLVVFGAGHDALPVVQLARDLGWHTEVVDPQARPASLDRFAMADKVTLGKHAVITPRTMALVMSHNYGHDLESLRFLLASPARYIGVLGPRQRTERMLTQLEANEEMPRLHSPAGLDIGANGPVEIALSIIAEMRAVLEDRHGAMLRERRDPIHLMEVPGWPETTRPA